MADSTETAGESSKSEKKSHLTLYIVGAIVAAIALSLALPDFAHGPVRYSEPVAVVGVGDEDDVGAGRERLLDDRGEVTSRSS